MDPWIHMPEDIRKGLNSNQKTIPSKYFYDQRGSQLFDQICELPEYYQTRTEKSLLDEHSPAIVRWTRAREIFELGSGTAMKTQVLIESFLNENSTMTYKPLDISISALQEAKSRLQSYSGLCIEPLVGDYTQNLSCISPNESCLVLFLGSTIGNLLPNQAHSMIASISSRLNPGDWFLLGVDLIKDPEIIEAAYNDSRGITAKFNKNILNVVNSYLDGNFQTKDFSHYAYFNRDKNQIEMHLTANKNVSVYLKKIDLNVHIRKGESILTEISRKFSRQSVKIMLEESNFRLNHWLANGNGCFALALAKAEPRSSPL